MLEALLERGTNINALNVDGKTALHVMVLRNRLDCVVALLSNSAEIDWRDKEGKTPLHVAVEMKLVPIVQCLVVFGCDINSANNQGQTPRHMVGKGGNESLDMILYILHSVGAKRCPEGVSKTCASGCCYGGDYNGIPPEAPESHEAREHIQQMLASTSTSAQRPNLMGRGEQGASVAGGPGKVVSDVTKEEMTGQTIMDTLMGMFTRTVKAEAVGGGAGKKESPTGSDRGSGSGGVISPASSIDSQVIKLILWSRISDRKYLTGIFISKIVNQSQWLLMFCVYKCGTVKLGCIRNPFIRNFFLDSL